MPARPRKYEQAQWAVDGRCQACGQLKDTSPKACRLREHAAHWLRRKERINAMRMRRKA